MQVLNNTRCANCNTRLEGLFCHHCGQREEPRVPTIRSVLGEVINALFGLESKLWRSLWSLLAKPGYLTQEFLAGKRQKYTTPFRLYLLLSIIVFAYMAYTGSGINIDVTEPAQNTELSTQAASSDEQGEDSAQEDFTQEKDGKKFNLNVDDMSINAGFLSPEREEIFETQLKQSLQKVEDDVNAGEIESVVSHIIEPLPKALLIFLPIVALFFKILFLGRGKLYLEHLVYLLHNHAFLFSVIMFSFLLEELRDFIPTIEAPLGFIVLFLWIGYVPFYFYKSLRRVYKVSRFATVLYGFLVFMVYFVLMTFMLIISLLIAGYTYT